MRTQKTPRKKQIRDAAQTHFREKGFSATSMRVLAKEVKMEAASLYFHYPSKQVLLHDICFEVANEFFLGLEAIDPNLTAGKKLVLAIENHLHVMDKNENAFFVFMNDWKHLSEPGLSHFKALRKKYESYFEKIIQEGINKKEFKNLDAKLTSQIILSSLNASFSWSKPQKMNHEVFSKHLIQLFSNGILK